jgi:ribonuclease G
LLVAANPQLARHCAEYLLAWEEEFRCRILLREDQSLQWGRFKVEHQGALRQAEHRMRSVEGGTSVVHRTDRA